MLCEVSSLEWAAIDKNEQDTPGTKVVPQLAPLAATTPAAPAAPAVPQIVPNTFAREQVSGNAVCK